VRRLPGSSHSARSARQIARTAAGLGSALDAEVWASQLLGMFSAQRYRLPFAEAVQIDPALLYGEPLVRELVQFDEPGAAVAIAAIAELSEGELGLIAKELLDRANLWRQLPKWAADLGESEIVAAAVMRDQVFDDGRTVFLESRHADGETLAVGLLIDNNLGGMAKDVLLAESIDQVATVARANPAGDAGQLVLERIDPGVAAGLFGEAIRLTDMTWDPPVAEDYWGGRALALLRADQTPGVVTPEDRPELPQAQREGLRDEFLASAEGAGFAPDGDEAWVAVLAIGFCADYVDGDPLRWSPVVVELFMADWVPRKVMTTDAMLSVLPGALDAWVRFAARKRGVPAQALAVTRAAIAEFTAEMRQRASDPEVGGPSKRFLISAEQAGVDVEDPDALNVFIAGWNARTDVATDGGSDRTIAPPAGAGHLGETILQVKITLSRVTKPPVWRRLQIPADRRLDEVHEIIQAAFGWQDCHLHVFEADGEWFGPADPDLELDCADERDFIFAELMAAGDRVTYIYDFGEDWRHEIRLENRLDVLPGVSYPVLVTAKGACPPEDCGGVWGYENLKAVLTDRDEEGHRETREWLGLADAAVFDPTAVDDETIRTRLATIRDRDRSG
jgi:hypothetical protein